MLIALHKNARTTSAVRAEIAASDETASVLAQRFGITEQTGYKWNLSDPAMGEKLHQRPLRHRFAGLDSAEHNLAFSSPAGKTPVDLPGAGRD